MAASISVSDAAILGLEIDHGYGPGHGVDSSFVDNTGRLGGSWPGRDPSSRSNAIGNRRKAPNPVKTRARRRPRAMVVVGARPQIIKLAAVGEALRSRLRVRLVHTGQHYDTGMSQQFFDELRIPEPDANLGIGSGTHGSTVGRMLPALESEMLSWQPAIVIVVGDTNSTLAGSLAAAKLNMPVAHLEAGLRSFDRRMPEEINRRLTDHMSSLLLCPTPAAVANLRYEGIRKGVRRVGDVMVDLLVQALPRAAAPKGFDLAPRSYYTATLHRAENVDEKRRLRQLIGSLEGLPRPVVLPLHPRTRARLDEFDIELGGSIRACRPLPYLEMLYLQKNARAVLTDSGGVQKEAHALGTPCITMRSSTEWVETLGNGANRLVDADPGKFRRAIGAVETMRRLRGARSLYGGGRAAERAATAIARFVAELTPDRRSSR